MKYCPECGEQLPGGQFCTNCGCNLQNYESQNEESERQIQEETEANFEMSRRELWYFGTVLGILPLAGVFAWFRLQEDPEDVAAEFVEAIGDGDLERADELLHRAIWRTDVGDLAESILGALGVDVAIDAVDVEVIEAETVGMNDDETRANTVVNTEIDAAGIASARGQIGIEVAKDEGDWRVISLDV